MTVLALIVAGLVLIGPGWWSPATDDPQVAIRGNAVEQGIASTVTRVRQDAAPWGFAIGEDDVNDWLASRLDPWLAHDDRFRLPTGWTDPRIRATSSFWDIAILALLLAQLVLGLISVPFSIATYEHGEVLLFMAWAQGIFTFQPDAASHIAHVGIVYKLHIVLGLTIFLVFPFTRLVHILSGFAAPFRYLFTRTGYQVVRSRRKPTEPAE